MLAAVRCPECTAPVRALPSTGATAACVYCGAAITLAIPAGRTEEHTSVVVRVGPSNVERVVRVLSAHLGVELEDGRARLARPPAEFVYGPNVEGAYAIASELSEAGAQVDLKTRQVTVPFRSVTLLEPGPRPLAVIVALRAEIELSVPEAKRIVAETPCVIAVGVEDGLARSLVNALEAAGARATAT